MYLLLKHINIDYQRSVSLDLSMNPVFVLREVLKGHQRGKGVSHAIKLFSTSKGRFDA